MNKKEIRKITYKTFAKLFYYPDKELVQLLYNGVVTDFFSDIYKDAEKFEKFKSWLNLFENKEHLLESLQIEYTSLFINNFPSLPAPPYKSFYFDKELFGPSAENVAEIYNHYNFEISKDIYELPDHIAIELEFISRIIEMDIPEDEINKFLKEQILSWSRYLEKEIIDNASIPFYSFIIKEINIFITNDINNEIELAGDKI